MPWQEAVKAATYRSLAEGGAPAGAGEGGRIEAVADLDEVAPGDRAESRRAEPGCGPGSSCARGWWGDTGGRTGPWAPPMRPASRLA